MANGKPLTIAQDPEVQAVLVRVLEDAHEDFLQEQRAGCGYMHLTKTQVRKVERKFRRLIEVLS